MSPPGSARHPCCPESVRGDVASAGSRVRGIPGISLLRVSSWSRKVSELPAGCAPTPPSCPNLSQHRVCLHSSVPTPCPADPFPQLQPDAPPGGQRRRGRHRFPLLPAAHVAAHSLPAFRNNFVHKSVTFLMWAKVAKCPHCAVWGPSPPPVRSPTLVCLAPLPTASPGP